MISGQIFLDLDQNGLFDGADQPMSNRTIRAGVGHRYTTSDEMGNFHIVVPSGTYVLTAYAGGFYAQAEPHPVVEVSGDGQVSAGHLLPMSINSVEPDLSSHIWGSLVRPGFQNFIKPICWNYGSAPASGSFNLVFDPQHEFVSADGNATVDGNTVVWDVTDLQPGASVMHYVLLSTPATVPLGTLMMEQVSVQADPVDNFPTNDVFVGYRPAVGSFDPNDKQVVPSVLTQAEVANGRTVEYTIRFQNTGTYLAETVRITDHLPQQVDPSSIEFIASSHTCHTTYQNGVLEFLFDDIMLPDSNANEPESHGFVMFRIKPVNTLLPGDSVWNRAYIYFDFNEPVITNAATFSVELSTTVAPRVIEAPAFSLWPSPVADVLNISMESPTNAASATIIDMNGRTIRRSTDVQARNGTLSIPVSDLTDGLYTLRIEHASGTLARRFVVSR